MIDAVEVVEATLVGQGGGGSRDSGGPPESGMARMRKLIIKFGEEEVRLDLSAR